MNVYFTKQKTCFCKKIGWKKVKKKNTKIGWKQLEKYPFCV